MCSLIYHRSLFQSKFEGVVDVQAIFMEKQQKPFILLLVNIDYKHRQPSNINRDIGHYMTTLATQLRHWTLNGDIGHSIGDTGHSIATLDLKWATLDTEWRHWPLNCDIRH